MTPLAQLARAVLAVGLEAVHPRTLMRQLTFTPRGLRFGEHALEPPGKLAVLAVGKAGGTLAEAFLTHSLRRPDAFWVYVSHQAPVPASVAPHAKYGSHPRVSQENLANAREIAAAVATLTPEDGLLLLLSGGSSALLMAPLPGLETTTVDALLWELMTAGATIAELNAVRKHLGMLFGGRLAALCPALLLALVLSDVPGDDLAIVGSGPTVPDPTTAAHALAILRRFGLESRFPQVVHALQNPESETPKPGDPRLDGKATALLGSNREALEAMAATLAAEAFRPRILTRRLRGEAREVGRILAALLVNAAPGTAILAGGETTVRVTGEGRGGRNLELALAAAVELSGHRHRCLLAAGSDGVDGTSPAAGAVVDGFTVARAAKRGKNAQQALAENDSWGFFADLPEAIITGPTGTNVADLVVGLVAPQAQRPLGLRTPTRAPQPQPPWGLKSNEEPSE
ncbi:D-glycerate 2-kinase [bacterium HR09]|nr:D-glycerate 2-kinase [bacterium HR09]